MTQQYDNDRRGVLFPNDRKESDRHPDYKGSCEIDGVHFWMDAWVKTGRDGNEFFSVSLKEKDTRKAQAPAQRQAPRQAPRAPAQRPAPKTAAVFDDMDDDIPFN
jgi:single-stranded DNA-binding protein